MSDHEDIKRIAATVFAEHGMQEAPSRSWRLGKPGTSCYAFRITWAPGMLAVSGDIGTAVYEVWPAFQTLEGAVDLVRRASFDYLSEKSGFRKEFDRDQTVTDLIREAYDSARNGHRSHLFKLLCDEYGGDPDDAQDRKEAMRSFRDDEGLTAERVYSITGDFEAPRESLPPRARWAFEAVKLWAAEMQSEAASRIEAAPDPVLANIDAPEAEPSGADA